MATRVELKGIERLRKETQDIVELMDKHVPRTPQERANEAERERYRAKRLSDDIIEKEESEYRQIRKKYPKMDKETYMACEMIAQGYTYTQAGMTHITHYKTMDPSKINDSIRINIKKYIQNRDGDKLIERLKNKRLKAVIEFDDCAKEIFTRLLDYLSILSNDDKISVKEKMRINKYIYELIIEKQTLDVKRVEVTKDKQGNSPVHITQNLFADAKQKITMMNGKNVEGLEQLDETADYEILETVQK